MLNKTGKLFRIKFSERVLENHIQSGWKHSKTFEMVKQFKQWYDQCEFSPERVPGTGLSLVHT